MREEKKSGWGFGKTVALVIIIGVVLLILIAVAKGQKFRYESVIEEL